MASNNGKETWQRLLAIIVIMAMLNVMGIPLTVIVFFGVVVFFVWRAVHHSEQQDIRGIFDFYIAANEILRDEERRWYGFEIADVINRGERVLLAMSDAPPLVYYSLGALHHRAGDYEAAVEHLSYLVESEQCDETRRFSHSPELQRYVQTLRHIERAPAEAPQTMAAIRSLDRARRLQAETLLAQSRQRLSEPAPSLPSPSATKYENGTRTPQQPGQRVSSTLNLPPPPPTMPAPISDVLRDLYEEKKEDHVN